VPLPLESAPSLKSKSHRMHALMCFFSGTLLRWSDAPASGCLYYTHTHTCVLCIYITYIVTYNKKKNYILRFFLNFLI
jgi:hypothetical protein